MTTKQPDLPMGGELDADTKQAMQDDPTVAPDTPLKEKPPAKTELDKLVVGREVTFTPEGSDKPLTLTIDDVREIIAKPTKSGKLPNDRQMKLFLKLCEYRKLNPFTGDVVLVGYDSRDKGTQFSPRVQIQVLERRANKNDHYDGSEFGVILWDSESSERIYWDGCTYPANESGTKGKRFTLLGGWSKVYRKDRSRCEKFEAPIKMFKPSFDNDFWKDGESYMIQKCARAGAFRQAFPEELGGMYTVEEPDPDDSRQESTKSKADEL